MGEREVLPDLLAPYREATRAPVGVRPWVLANMVAGLDGSTAIDGRVRGLSGLTDRHLFVDLRSVADVVLVGAGTARREHYGPITLPPERRTTREAVGMPPVPRLALVSRSLDFDGAEDALEPGEGGGRPILITCESSPIDARARLGERADIVVSGADRVDVSAALEALHGLGADVVLCEGGPSLLGDLFGVAAVDELCLTLTPVVGGDPLPVAQVPEAADLARARLGHVLRAGDDLFLRYLFR